MSTFRRTRTRRIGRKLSPPARRDGKVNCRLCYTSGDDVANAKRLESCRREAKSPKKGNRERKKIKRVENVKTRRLVPREVEVHQNLMLFLFLPSGILIKSKPPQFIDRKWKNF